MTHAGQSPDPYLIPHWESAALVTIDMQVDFLSDSPYGLAGTTEIVPNLRRLADAFRAGHRPIVHVVRLYQPDGSNADLLRRRLLANGARIVAPGSAGSELAPGLLPAGAPRLDHARLLDGRHQELGPAEYVIFKPRWGAFYRTPLASLLDDLAVDTIIFAGCNLPNCPRASIIEASERDYRVVLATDAVSQASEQGFREINGLGVQLMGTDEITAALAARSGDIDRRAPDRVAPGVRLFSYGTLQQRDVQLSLFGRELDGSRDRLPGYELSMVEITDPEVVAVSGSDRHPILRATGDSADQVDGTVYEISEAELTAADRYEVADYARALVPLTSGVRAWVYAAAHRTAG